MINLADIENAEAGGGRGVFRDPVRRFVCLCFVGFCAFIGWSAYAQVDELVHAQGKMSSSYGTQVIQAVDPGRISTVLVHEGQQVEKGQVLVQLDRSRALAAYQDSAAKVAALRATLVRLRCEVFGGEPDFSSSGFSAYPEFVANQAELYKRRQQALQEATASFNNSLHIAREELGTVQPLLARGDIGKADVLRLRRQISDLEGQIVNMRNKYFQDAQAEMTKAEEELSTREQELADRSELLSHTILTAPIGGIVRDIAINTAGATVRPGEEIMHLVPSSENLRFEAKLKPSDVAFVRKNAPTTVKLDAYDYSIYGVLHGSVTFVSPDAITEQTPRGEEIYYRIHVSIPGEQMRKFALQPGMTGQVDVHNGSRSVLSFLTKPIIKTMSESLTER